MKNTNCFELGQDWSKAWNDEDFNKISQKSKKSLLFDKCNKFNSNNKILLKNIYDEYANLPLNINQAIKTKKNLTLKQILILMNLHTIPSMLMNVIHDNLQKCFQRKFAKINYNKKIFFVSYYNWWNLHKIFSMIWSMLDL